MNTLTTRPSRIRWLILALLFFISVVTYIDRVNISVTARQMMPAYGMTDQQMGWVFSAFVVGYALFQIPGGWLADRWGVRVVLTGAIRAPERARCCTTASSNRLLEVLRIPLQTLQSCNTAVILPD